VLPLRFASALGIIGNAGFACKEVLEADNNQNLCMSALQHSSHDTNKPVQLA